MRQFILAVCVVVAINIHITASYSESDLVVVSNGINYEGAVNLCKSRGMNLVKIDDEQTNQMVYNFVVKRNLGKYWIDGKREAAGKPWVHTGGSKLTYSKWHAGEPNNARGDEHCIEGFYFKDPTWNDNPCFLNNAAICYAEKSNLAQATIDEKQLVALVEKTGYKAAVNLCRSRGMNLVKIEDEQTNQMVYNFVVKRNLGKYWINGQREAAGKPWVHTDGSKLTYSKWHAGEPNNARGDEHCIEGFYFKDPSWNDNPCSLNNAVICYAEKSNLVQVTIDEKQLVALVEKADYKAAVNLCISQGMNLIKIDNEATNQIVYDFAVKKGLGQYWIDANDIVTDGVWVDNGGNKILYSKWHPGEPNGRTSENCVHGLFYKNGFWNDINCNIKISVICYKTSLPTKKIETEVETKVESKIETVNIYLTNEKAGYNDAVQYCKSQDLRLISVEDATMNKAIYDMAVRKNLRPYWIDGNDKNKRESWVDSSGNPLTYKNFKSSTLENSKNAHCINVNKNEFWTRVSCDSTNNIICFENKA